MTSLQLRAHFGLVGMPESCGALWAILANLCLQYAWTHLLALMPIMANAALISTLCTTDYNMFLPNIPGFAAAIFTTVSCYALASLKVRTSCCWCCPTVIEELLPDPFSSSSSSSHSAAYTPTCSLDHPSMQLLELQAASFWAGRSQPLVLVPVPLAVGTLWLPDGV